MSKARHAVIATWVALFSTPLFAGQERESFSTTSGVFLSFEIGGLVSFATQDQLLQLADHCNKGRSVFDHVRHERYRCKSLSQSDMGRPDFVRIELLAVRAQDTGERPHVYSIGPTRATTWETRPLSEEDVGAISALLRSDAIRYGSLVTRLQFKRAIAVRKPNAGLATYFVPGEKDENEDAFYSAERHHVFISGQGDYRYQGKLIVTPTHFVDLDGDELPETVVEESCDGLCISLWSIHNGPKSLERSAAIELYATLASFTRHLP